MEKEDIELVLQDKIFELHHKYTLESIEEDNDREPETSEMITERINIKLFNDLYRLFEHKYKQAQVDYHKLKDKHEERERAQKRQIYYSG